MKELSLLSFCKLWKGQFHYIWNCKKRLCKNTELIKNACYEAYCITISLVLRHWIRYTIHSIYTLSEDNAKQLETQLTFFSLQHRNFCYRKYINRKQRILYMFMYVYFISYKKHWVVSGFALIMLIVSLNAELIHIGNICRKRRYRIVSSRADQFSLVRSFINFEEAHLPKLLLLAKKTP